MKTKIKDIKGITLIALIITIIILIILAGTAINISIGENGIFNKVQEAKEKYTVESIREKVEIGIMEQEIEEIALGNPVTIELILQELVENGTFESIDKDANIGNIGEYEVKLKYNEEGKVVIEYIQKATGVRTTWSLNPKGYTNGDKVSILLTVQGKVKSVTKPDGLVRYSEKETLSIDYEVTANGTYTFMIEDEKGNKQEKNVIVDTIDRLEPNDFTITAESIQAGINITAKAEDAKADTTNVKSGIERYEYFVKGDNNTEYKKYETNKIEGLEEGTYSVYVIAYDKAGNSKQSTTIIVKVTCIYGQYVNYGIDIDDDGDTTNDWIIFYKEEELTSEYYGATYIIPDYYVPYEKMKKSISNVGMRLYSGTYRVYMPSAPTNFVKRNNYETVKKVFKYDYTGESQKNVYVVSRLLDTTAWDADFVTPELKTKGGMAIGGPTLNMLCASWNKGYSKEKLTPTISGTGYQVNGINSLYINSDIEEPNMYFPTKNPTSDGTTGYRLASPSSYNGSCVMDMSYTIRVKYSGTEANYLGMRPLVYIPSSVQLTQDLETPNLWNINYGE